MNNNLYKSGDKELPFLIETRNYKWVEDGKQKNKFDEVWAVLTENVNDFIQELPSSKNGKSLNQPSVEKRGPLSIVTVGYGDKSYSQNGEIDWWSCSNGVLSFHIRRWIKNTPNDIKAFCQSCMTSYGYEPDEVTVSCNPEAGESHTMCEATFTPDIETNSDYDPTLDDNWGESGGETGGDETEEIGEEGESINSSSTIDTITPSAELYLSVKMGSLKPWELINIVNGVENGELIYLEVGDIGTEVKVAGWYRYDDTNPNTTKSPKYYDTGDTTKERVDKARIYLKSIPDVMIPSIRVTVTKKVTAADKMTLSSISNSMSKAGEETTSIEAGSTTIPAPKNLKATDAEGNEYVISKTVWLNEGSSFDGTSIRKRSSLTTGKTFYEGTTSTSYRSISRLAGIEKEGH